ncbi:MAG: hypothetical protein QOJ74_780, partial [Ilumatobacteraceae bacterium]|nr:hypothetical protein [Ilumatobacteraceae bacterium]
LDELTTAGLLVVDRDDVRFPYWPPFSRIPGK